LLSLSEALDLGSEQLAKAPARGRPKKVGTLKPIAPFDTDHAVAVAYAFDRGTGKPLAASVLKTYADALAHYHLSPESKFLNAKPFDRGTTLRRHVRITEAKLIGKESHDWERQAMLGLDIDLEVNYGFAPHEREELTNKLREFVAKCGQSKAARMLGTSVARLKAFTSDEEKRPSDQLVRRVAARLPAAIELWGKLSHDRQAGLHCLYCEVQRDGLRVVARRHGVDPSNLRRKLERRRAT